MSLLQWTPEQWVEVLGAIGTLLTAIASLLANRRHQATMVEHVETVKKVTGSIQPPAPGGEAR